MIMRYSYRKALVCLKDYAENGGLEVIFAYSGTSHINWTPATLNDLKKVYIEKHTPESQTYLFLHELGHYELRKNWKKFKKRLPVIAYAEEMNVTQKVTKFMRRKDYIVSSLEEEFMAWEEGLKLAGKLGIIVNPKRWISIKSDCLKGYISYYATLKK